MTKSRAPSAARAVLNSAYELESSLSMINFVAMGSGCSLLPEYVRNIRQNGVVYKPLRPPNLVNPEVWKER